MVLFEKNEVLLKGFRTLQLSFKCSLQMHAPYLSRFQSPMQKSSESRLGFLALSFFSYLETGIHPAAVPVFCKPLPQI